MNRSKWSALESRAASRQSSTGVKSSAKSGTKTKAKSKLKDDLQRPPMFNVIIHNDDFTPFDFVVELVRSVFMRNKAEAVKITKTVHASGHAVAGTYTREVAESKVRKGLELAASQLHPLKISFEEQA